MLYDDDESWTFCQDQAVQRANLHRNIIKIVTKMHLLNAQVLNLYPPSGEPFLSMTKARQFLGLTRTYRPRLRIRMILQISSFKLLKQLWQGQVQNFHPKETLPRRSILDLTWNLKKPGMSISVLLV